MTGAGAPGYQPMLLAVPLLLLALPAARPRQETPRAFDGRRGFGSEPSLAEVLALFRKPTDEDERFLADLDGLEARLLLRLEETRALYLARGWLGGLAPDLAGLAQRVEAGGAGPRPAGPGPARLLAGLLLDVRLRVRADVLRGWERDARELAAGLACLRANTNGCVRSREEEAAQLAVRLDLAASRLRARLLDLGALAEPPGSRGEAPAEELEALAVLLVDPEAGEGRIEELLRPARERARAMGELLFTRRLEPATTRALAWRDEVVEGAARIADQVRLWRPDTEEGASAPEEIRSEKRTTRRRRAFGLALSGLGLDPLNEELAYAAGRMGRYVSGEHDTCSSYDRYLALRGIRLHDDRAWRGRELTAEELDAKSYVEDVLRRQREF